MSEKKEQLNTGKKRFHISLALQVAFFFTFAAMVTGIASFFALRAMTDRSVRREKENQSLQITLDLATTLYNYDTLDILWEYWIRCADELDVEYYRTEKTADKESALIRKHPDFVISEATREEVMAFSEEDRRTYAEIMYTWVIEDFNTIRTTYDIDFVYVLASTQDLKHNLFLISGADPEMPRSKNYGDAYVLGTPIESTDSQTLALKTAMENSKYLLKNGEYLDCYNYLGQVGADWRMFLGVSFNLPTHLDAVKQDTKRGVINFILMQIALSVICLVLLFFFTIRPVHRIQTRVRAYKETKDSETALRHLMRIRSGNELGELKDDIAECILEIEDYTKEIREITTEQERIRTELSVATKIQADMLPKRFPAFPDHSEFDIYATMTPAREVGGDFYDFFLVDDDHLAMVIADVSGKGVPAALFMVTSMSLIRNRTLLGGTPGRILEDVNNQLCENNESGFFVTVWMAILEISTGRGIAANAGHEHPILRKAGGDFELVKYRHSPAVATMEGMSFREHEFLLEPGDRLYVYTDGVPEATNEEKELFGEERTLATLNRDPEADLKGMLENVKAEIDAFAGEAEQFDDITMLALDFYGETR